MNCLGMIESISFINKLNNERQSMDSLQIQKRILQCIHRESPLPEP